MATENFSINLNRIVSSISGKDILERILREAITNSIHANATKIDCTIITAETIFNKALD